MPDRARSAARLALVQAALEALDRGDAARLAISTEGMVSTTKTTGAVHVHPCVKVEREARSQFSKIWHDLSLHFDHDVDGRSMAHFMKRQKEEHDEMLAAIDQDAD